MRQLKKFNFESDKIIADLSDSDKQLVLDKAKDLHFSQGKLLFYEQGIPTGIFILRKGKAKIYKTGIHGKDQIFYIYKEGDLLGYHALLCNEKYEDSCELLEDSIVSFINKTDFDKLLVQIPKLKNLLIENMSHEFGVLVNTITILSQKTVRERLALYLLLLNERYAVHPPLENIEIGLSRNDMANVIGTARESMGRLLKEFKDEGLININRKNIIVVNQKHLYKLAFE